MFDVKCAQYPQTIRNYLVYNRSTWTVSVKYNSDVLKKTTYAQYPVNIFILKDLAKNISLQTSSWGNYFATETLQYTSGLLSVNKPQAN